MNRIFNCSNWGGKFLTSLSLVARKKFALIQSQSRLPPINFAMAAKHRANLGLVSQFPSNVEAKNPAQLIS